MRYRHGHTLCISTQVGCRMGCAFCASTLAGTRPDGREMLAQIIAANGDLDGRIGIVVMMGSGSRSTTMRPAWPPAAGKAARGAGHHRSVSLSTCGQHLRRALAAGLPVTLSVTLHAPDDDAAAHHAHRAAVRDWRGRGRGPVLQQNRRRVIFEYARVRNDVPSRPAGWPGCCRDAVPREPVRSQVPETGLLAAHSERAAEFERELVRRGVSVTAVGADSSDIEGAQTAAWKWRR